MKRNKIRKKSNDSEEESSNPQNVIEISSNTESENDCNNKRISLIEYFREYTENTSLHGFKYLGEKYKSAPHKVWWILMITLSIIVCGFLINSLWKKWDKTPVIVSFSKSTTQIWTIPFPAITICPSIRVRRSIFNFNEKSGQNLSEEENHEYHIIAGICETCLLYECSYFKYKFVNDSVIDKIIQVSPTLNDTFMSCGMEMNIECVSSFTPILTDEGLCFTMNMLDSKDIYKEDVKQYDQYDFLKNKDNDGWNIDSGYNKNLPVDTYPRRGRGSGLRSAIVITIQKNSSESNNFCDLFSQGFKVMVHSPINIPKLTNHFYWVHPEMETMLSIKPRMMKTSDVLRNYTPHKRMCYFSDEKPLRFFKNFTQENCELECLTNYTMALCGCVAYDMPRDDSMPLCGIGLLLCTIYAAESIQTLQIKLKNTTINDIYTQEKAKEIASKCDCLPACTSIDYDVEISDSRVDWRKVQSENKDNSSYGEISEIKIFFKEPYFITTKRSELYGLIDFLANCGGLLGVCLGFSILSLVEILYFATLRFFSYLRSNNKKIEEKTNKVI